MDINLPSSPKPTFTWTPFVLPSVAPPKPIPYQSAAERSRRDKRLHDIQARQADIEAQKAALLRRLDKLELEGQLLRQEGDDLQWWLNLSKNFIDRLPDELLVGIFQEYVQPYYPPETLLLVSRRWFHTAVGAKSLWADLRFYEEDQTPERAPRLIHRRLILSDPTPIEVDDHYFGFSWVPAEDGRWFPTSVIVGEDGEQCRRIRKLAIRRRESLNLLEWPLPQLESLTYGSTMLRDPSVHSEMKKWEHHLNFSKMPNLRTLHICGLNLSNPHPSILANIRTLKLTIYPETYSPNDFQSYIAAAMYLRTLEITFTVYPSSAQVEPTFLIHTTIRSLSYHDENIIAGRCLLNRLDIPAADNLDIRMHDLERIASLAQGPLDQMFRLRIEVHSKSSRTSQQGDVLVDLLRQARKLEELVLAGACIILAPECMDALEADDNLCPELRTFTVTSFNVLDGINREALEQRIRDRYSKLHRS